MPDNWPHDGMGGLSVLSDAMTRSVGPSGQAIGPGATAVLADIDGPGVIRHIWLAPAGHWRFLILRIYWDGQQHPSVECPVGDFFACGWNQYAPVSSLAVCVNPGGAFNCYWPMPFRRHCRVTLTNIAEVQASTCWQIDYALLEVPPEAAYLHAQFRRMNPVVPRQVYSIVDEVVGQGHYVGTYLAWGVTNTGWWGEGEIKFYIDGDRDFPTICGTGTEDYFCGSYNFDLGKDRGGYREFTTPYSGLPQVIRPDGLYQSQTRFGLYRWHIMDPVRFSKRLRVTMQDLGWGRSGGRFLARQDDIASVAYWYQTLPTVRFPALPEKDRLEIV